MIIYKKFVLVKNRKNNVVKLRTINGGKVYDKQFGEQKNENIKYFWI